MNYKKITIDGKTVYRCTGEGAGACQRCTEQGKWTRFYMCRILYQLTPDDDAPCYCSACIREVLK